MQGSQIKKLLLLQQPKIFIYSWSGQSTHPRKLRYIEHSRDKRQIVLIENWHDAVLCGFRSSDAFAFGFCVLHAASDSVADHAKLQLCEDAAHLDEGLAHGVDCAFAAVCSDAARGHRPKILCARLWKKTIFR